MASGLIPIGYRASEVAGLLDAEPLGDLEIVIRPPRPYKGRDARRVPYRHVQDPLPALRKSLLRLLFRDRICIRQLNAEDDFRQYFALRYRVWKEMNHLPEEQDCWQSKWELSFTDRTAYPLVRFHARGRIDRLRVARAPSRAGLPIWV
jgi:hypothetical protein